MTPIYVKLKGLKEGVNYKETETGKIYPADILMEVGLPLISQMQEYQAYQVHLVICDMEKV